MGASVRAGLHLPIVFCIAEKSYPAVTRNDPVAFQILFYEFRLLENRIRKF